MAKKKRRRGKLPKNPAKGVSRYDSDKKRMHGWQVRVQWAGDHAYKRFSDEEYGGPESALAAAIQWRNEVEEGFGKPRTEKWIRASGVSYGKEWRREEKD